MVHQTIRKSSSWNLLTQEKSSQFALRPLAVQAQQDSHRPPTQEEIENEASNQNKFEAFGLELKEKSGTITTVEQERLGVLQATLDDFWAQRLERASRFGHSFANIPVHSPDQQVSAPVQPKLAIQRAVDRYKQQSPQQSPETASNGGMGWVQRAFPATPAPQSHPMPPLQAKLAIGQPEDEYEQEADRVASQVVEQVDAPTSAQATQGQSVQLQANPEGEDLQAESILQRREAIGGGEASTDLASAINRARGGGQPLDAGLQQRMGQAMGANFSGVRVHTDAQSDQLNQSIQAKAFTTGQDVFFRQGEYQPGSRGGQKLIAHELTHVVQQKGDAVKSDQGKERVERIAKWRGISGGGYDGIPAIQRMVPPGQQPGTKVKIKRTTSEHLHGEVGTIVRQGDTSYEYIVDVKGEKYIVSLDQIVPEAENVGAVKIEATLGQLNGMTAEEILNQVRERVAAVTKVPKEVMTVGGSFAAYVHAVGKKKGARTPRDIDIILPATTFDALMRDERRDIRIWGIPVEFHREGTHVRPAQNEKAEGIISRNTLLAKNIKKLREQNYIFKKYLPKQVNVQHLVQEMERNTAKVLDELQHDQYIKEDYSRHAPIWVKGLKDIKLLVEMGATLDGP